MKKTISTIILSVLIAATLTLTVGAEEADKIDILEEETTIATTAATDGQETAEPADAEEPATEKVEDIGAEVEQTDADDGEKGKTTDANSMTEEELREVILRVADAVGAYEDEIPAAGKAKEWIIGNLASIVGFLMAAAMLVATPVGKKIFGNFLKTCKKTLETIKEWKEELEGVITKNGEKNAELRAAVNEMMSVLKRENEDAIRRAEIAEQNAEQNAKALIEAEAKAAEAETRATDVCEAVCRALLVMAKPLETTIQRSKALDEMQKDEFYADYKKSVDMIKALIEGTNNDGKGEDVAD